MSGFLKVVLSFVSVRLSPVFALLLLAGCVTTAETEVKQGQDIALSEDNALVAIDLDLTTFQQNNVRLYWRKYDPATGNPVEGRIKLDRDEQTALSILGLTQPSRTEERLFVFEAEPGHYFLEVVSFSVPRTFGKPKGFKVALVDSRAFEVIGNEFVYLGRHKVFRGREDDGQYKVALLQRNLDITQVQSALAGYDKIPTDPVARKMTDFTVSCERARTVIGIVTQWCK